MHRVYLDCIKQLTRSLPTAINHSYLYSTSAISSAYKPTHYSGILSNHKDNQGSSLSFTIVQMNFSWSVTYGKVLAWSQHMDSPPNDAEFF